MAIENNNDLKLFLKAAFPAVSETLSQSLILKKKAGDGSAIKKVMLFFEGSLASVQEQSIEEYIKQIDPSVSDIIFIGKKGLVTEAIVLRVIKIYQPIIVEEMALDIEKGGYLLDIQKLRNLVDLLRKKRFVYRLSDGKYALTEKGLKTVPHGNYRVSSDIIRALALGKKRGNNA